jgi:hypothetical protein
MKNISAAVCIGIIVCFMLAFGLLVACRVCFETVSAVRIVYQKDPPPQTQEPSWVVVIQPDHVMDVAHCESRESSNVKI